MPQNFDNAKPETLLHLEAMMAIMRDMKWKRGVTGREYAKAHGYSYDHVKHLSAEAWRRVCAEVLDKDRVGATAGMVAEQIMLDALSESYNPALIERGKGSNGEPHVYQESPNVARKVALEAAKVLAAIAGADAPKRIELEVKGEPTAADARRIMQQKFGDLTPDDAVEEPEAAPET